MDITSTKESITSLIEAHKQSIADLETISVILDTVADLIRKPTTSELFEFDYGDDTEDFIPKLINPLAPAIVGEVLTAIAKEYSLDVDIADIVKDEPAHDKLYLTPREG